MILPHRRELGFLHIAGACDESWAAGMEGAARWPVLRMGNRAFDGRQAFPWLGVDAGDGSQKRFRVGMLRIAENLLHRCLLHDPPQIHHRHLIRNLGNHPQIVGDEYHRHSRFCLQAL
jgi:hypothetical protein